MAQLVVRNIEEKVVRNLRSLAAREGVSMEEEHRRILRAALLKSGREGVTFSDYLMAMPQASKNEPSDLFKRQGDLPREIDL